MGAEGGATQVRAELGVQAATTASSRPCSLHRGDGMDSVGRRNACPGAGDPALPPPLAAGRGKALASGRRAIPSWPSSPLRESAKSASSAMISTYYELRPYVRGGHA